MELTENEFSKHVNTKFRVKVDVPALGDRQLELELVKVKSYAKKEEEHSGMERFSAFFQGPADVHMAQQSYTLEHAAMGEFEIFLVPISQTEAGFQYEAVFNYFKKEVMSTE